MKFKAILAIAATAALALTACEQKEEDLGAAAISLNPTELSFEAGSDSKSVALIATRDWTLVESSLPEWAAVDKKNGSASTKEQTVTVSVDENKGNDRVAELQFTIGFAKATLTVNQKGEQGELKMGSGTVDDPYTVAGVIEYLGTLGADVTSPDVVYVKGKVSEVAVDNAGVEQYFSNTGTYGNATFFISDDGTAVNQFECYRVRYLGNKTFQKGDTDIVLGDDVIICGKVVNYKGNTPETSQGTAFLYSLNGVTDGGGETVDYSNAPAKTVAEFITAADKTTYYKLTGVVTGFNPTYCSMDITDNSGSIYVYSVANKDEWSSKISNGGTVVLAGQYDYYSAKSQHEVVNAYILSFTEGQGGGEAKGSGTLADPFNADGAVAYVKANGDKESTDDVYVKGKISSIRSTFDVEHGTAIFNISDDGSATATQFTAYSVYYLGNRAWEDGDAQVAVGDEVVLCGKVTCYSGTYETSSKNAYIYSINGKTSIEQNAAFGVEKTEISVGASATTATINVTGNVAWTASGDDVTVSPASGEGKGAVTVSFAANTDTENAKTYKVTVSTTADVATKSFEVTITQAKAAAAGTSEVVISIKDYASDNNWTNGTKYTSVEKDGVTLNLASGGGNSGKYYSNGEDWRFYQSENPVLNLSVAEGMTFVSAKIEYNISNTGVLANASDGSSIESGTETTAQSYTVKNSGSATNGQARITKVTVTVK